MTPEDYARLAAVENMLLRHDTRLAAAELDAKTAREFWHATNTMALRHEAEFSARLAALENGNAFGKLNVVVTPAKSAMTDEEIVRAMCEVWAARTGFAVDVNRAVLARLRVLGVVK